MDERVDQYAADGDGDADGDAGGDFLTPEINTVSGVKKSPPGGDAAGDGDGDADGMRGARTIQK